MAKLVKKKTPPADDLFLRHTHRMAELAAEKKAADISAYDVRGLTVVADSLVLCTAASEPQMRAVCESVREGMKKIGVSPLHIEGTPRDGWLLMDYGAIIFHVFRPKARAFYDLDGMWADAPAIPLEGEGAP